MWVFYPYEAVRKANRFATVKHPHRMWVFYPYEAVRIATVEYSQVGAYPYEANQIATDKKFKSYQNSIPSTD
jgi:hypothetical protein